MKKLLISLTAAALLSPIAHAENTDGDLLTGDVRLACEAILCLSSGDRPSECAPSLKRYFSINHKKLSDTLRGRKNFLELCPASNEENMPELINAIANGAGRCDAKELNRINQRIITVENPEWKRRGCDKPGYGKWRLCDNIKPYMQITIIENKLPQYCSAYFDHAWTDLKGKGSTQYQGNPKEGGHWVDIQ
ncbi:TrbM/KikA/MpfK family conjugal transfer protein [Stenoxybacter acetivorans]|uniref:TrbM/KikA/MpfK family conjugal transfer protein n=1 Tax=Stenoxybacter acetivorans TaxID=422441 RepID=UPI00056113A0|nr:TrbM/KikA/MpfK family conjugal transfer protein [Stenoxybacter acetivorans]